MAITNSQNEMIPNGNLDFQYYTELPNNNPLAVVDMELRIVYCNDSFKNKFGLDVNSTVYKMNSNPEFVYLIRGFCESHYKNITVDINLTSEVEISNQFYSVAIERVFIRHNQYFVLSIESLAQRKKLENKITSLHNALDYGKLPLMIIDDKFRINYVSKYFEVVLNKEIENIYNKEFIDIIGDFVDQGEIEEVKIALNDQKSWKRLICLHKKVPHEYWELNLNPINVGEEEKVNFILIANNLTEHINQTRAIERSEKKQKLIINNISDLLLIVEHVGVGVLFENANDNFCKTFGLDKNKIYSLKIQDFIPAGLTDDIYVAIQNLTQQSIGVYQFNYRHIDSKEYVCKITSILERERNSSYYIITMKDVTDEILYREQLKKAYHKEMLLNKMKSDFLANMSHEIRTPFNAVVGFSEVIDESIETGDVEMLRELMDSMKEVLGRALNLFTNIIEVSQIEGGEVELETVDLNVNAVVRNVFQKMQKDAQRKKFEYLLDICEEDCMVEVDWVKYEKVVSMIIDNAIKYTNEGHVYVGTKIVDNFVQLIVSDTGVGIEQAQIDRLLKPFTQEIEGYTRPFEGAGLGLTIAYKLTQVMNGHFEIISQKGKGTKITVSFALTK